MAADWAVLLSGLAGSMGASPLSCMYLSSLGGGEDLGQDQTDGGGNTDLV